MLRQFAPLGVALALVAVLAGCGGEPDKKSVDACSREFVELYNDLDHLYTEIKRPERDPASVLHEALATCDRFQFSHGPAYACSAKKDGLDIQVSASDQGWFCWHVRHLAGQPYPEWIVSQNSATEPQRKSSRVPAG